MAIISPAAVKKCVTCEYWGGVRAASPTGREVKYKLNMTGCVRWIKWSRLR